MDKTITHLHGRSRRVRLDPPVATVGWLPEKANITTRRFQSVNYSFVLSGSGSYQAGRQGRVAVQAPCLLLQRPGVDYRFGPDGVWSELYVMYDESWLGVLTDAGLLPSSGGAFPLLAGRRWRTEVDHVLGLLHEEPHAERLDRACAGMLMEAFLALVTARPEDRDPTLERIRGMREALETDPGEAHDVQAWAEKLEMSPVHLRRLWRRHYHEPPVRFLARQRVRLACRLLVETDRPLKQIADESGYPDPQYFSRRFRELTGQSPRAYRRQHGFERG